MGQTNTLCGNELTLKQSNRKPIVFAEWTLLLNSMMLRKDFELSEMLEYRSPERKESSESIYKEPKAIATYRPIAYWRVSECQKR